MKQKIKKYINELIPRVIEDESLTREQVDKEIDEEFKDIIYPIAITREYIEEKSERKITDEEFDEVKRLIKKGLDHTGSMVQIAIEEALYRIEEDKLTN